MRNTRKDIGKKTVTYFQGRLVLIIIIIYPRQKRSTVTQKIHKAIEVLQDVNPKLTKEIKVVFFKTRCKTRMCI